MEYKVMLKVDNNNFSDRMNKTDNSIYTLIDFITVKDVPHGIIRDEKGNLKSVQISKITICE